MECNYAVELYLLEELVCWAMTLSGQTVSSNLVLLNKCVLNSLSAVDRQLLVELE